nr:MULTISPECIES: hypothetical protein [unclassified Nonomuraea]
MPSSPTTRHCPPTSYLARVNGEFVKALRQVRDAVSAPGADDPELMGPVLGLFARALPYTLRAEERPEGTAVELEVTGPAGGRWHAARRDGRLRMCPAGAEPAARVSMDQDTFWRLATRGVTPEQARERAGMSGDAALASAVTTLLAIVA